ncbi:MAG: PQQ-binding-like beta-propeller repeat protein [Bacillota bacterium]|jgi:outer membrane protein assembly factor BamB
MKRCTRWLLLVLVAVTCLCLAFGYWRRPLYAHREGSLSSLLAFNDSVYYGTDFTREAGALSLMTGRKLWETKLSTDAIEITTLFGAGEAVLCAGGSSIFCLQADSGVLRWTRELAGHLTALPVLAGGSIFAATLNGVVYSLDAQTGDVKWMLELGSRVIASPVPIGSQLLVGDLDGYVHVLDSVSGKDMSRIDVGFPIAFLGANQATVLAFSDELEHTRVVALEYPSLFTRWRATLPDTGGDGAQALLTEERVFIASFSGQLNALDMGTGEVLWQQAFKTGLTHFTPMRLDDDRLLVQSGDTIHILRQNGDVVGSMSLPGKDVIRDLALHGDQLLVVSGNSIRVLRLPK